MKIIAVVAYILVFIGLPQVQAVPLSSQPSSVGTELPKAMLWQLIAPDGSEHLLLGTAHRLGLRLEQLPEVVGAIKQANILIGELSPLWDRQQHVTTGTQSMFSEVERALSIAIAPLDKDGDKQEETIARLRKLRDISNIVHKVRKLKNDPTQLNSLVYFHRLRRNLKAVGDMLLPSNNVQIVAEGEAKIDIGGTEVYFNPSDELEFMVVQLLATAFPDLIKVFLTKQDAGETVTFHDPESSNADQNHQPLVGQLGEEYERKLRNMLRQYDSNPFTNLLSLTLKHQKVALVNAALTSIALHEASKDYGDFLKPNGSISLDLQIRATLGKSKHVALEEHEDLQQAVDRYYSEASEHFQSLDNFIGDTARLKKLIDYGSLDAAIGTFKQYYAAYLKGDVMQASKIRNESPFNPYFEDILIDERNLNWMRKGKIQEYCKAGNQCLVYAGFAHFLRGKNPLFKLLPQEGFEIKELTAAQRDEIIAASASDSHAYEGYELDGERGNELNSLERARRGDKLAQPQLNEALLEAASRGELELVKWAIAQGVDDNFIGQALLEAVTQEHEAVAELLVANLPEDDADRVINRAAYIAALQGKLQIVKFLVSKGANDFNVYLINAAYGGDRAVVEYLIAQRADSVEEALTNAVFRGHTELVKFLIPKLEEKKSPEDFRLALNNLLPFSVDNKGMKMLELLVEAGADDFNNLLLHAANVGNKEKIEFAVKKGADNFTEAFLQAVSVDHSRTVKYFFNRLRQKSGEVNDVAMQAFSHALVKENTKLAKFFVRENAVSIDIATMLTIGAQHEDMLEYVVQRGVNDSTWTWTASTWTLQHAATNGWMKTLKIILDELNHNPHEALLLASSNGNEEIVKLILQIGVGIDSLRTARDLALLYENDNIHQLLSDKLEEGNLLTASTRVKKFFDANISLVADNDDVPLSEALAEKIVHNNMYENNAAFTSLDVAVKDAGDWHALAVAIHGKRNYKIRNSLVRAVVAGKDKQMISEVVLLHRLIRAVQKLEGGKAQKHARNLGIKKSSSDDGYTYSAHLEGKRVFNFTKMQAHIDALRTQYADNKELHDVLGEVEVQVLKKLRE